MSSSVSETLSPIRQTNKLHPREETTIDRDHGHARLSPPATFKTPSNNDIEGEDDPGSCSDSSIGDSNPVIPARGDATQSNVGRRTHHSVATLNRSEEDLAGTSGIIAPQDSTRTRSYIRGSASASVRCRSEAGALPTVDQKRRSSSRHSSTGGLDVMDSGGRVYGEKEPPSRQRGCLTTAAFLKLVSIKVLLSIDRSCSRSIDCSRKRGLCIMYSMYVCMHVCMYVCMYVLCMYVFIKLHITTQSGPVILVILCHSH